MDHRTRLLRRLALFAGAALLISCGLAGLLYTPVRSADARARDLARAEQRWAARSFSHYRLVLRAASWCRTDVEVRDERIARVFENTCPSAPRTVSELFDQVRQLDSDVGRIFCAPAGCECTEVRFVQADYDVQLGFPRSIRVRRLRETNWQGLWDYVPARGLPNCLTPLDLDVVNVLSLQPLS